MFQMKSLVWIPINSTGKFKGKKKNDRLKLFLNNKKKKMMSMVFNFVN